MLTVANGIRPNPPHEKTVVLLTDGLGMRTQGTPDNIDRLIVIGLGPGVIPTLPSLASSPDDYKEVTNTCEIINFVKEQICCRKYV